MSKTESLDAAYHQRLEERFATGDERSFDLWLGNALDTLLYPICQETADTTLSMSKLGIVLSATSGAIPIREKINSYNPNPPTVFEKSHKAEYACVLPQNILLYGTDLFPHLSVWTEDETIPQDLLRAVSVMVKNIPAEESERLARENPTLFKMETARGAVSGDQAVYNSTAEGILAIAESVNISLGQLVDEGFPLPEEDMVGKIIKNSVPTQLARYLPFAELGHHNSSDTFIPALLVLINGRLRFNPACIATANEAKSRARDDKRKHSMNKFGISKEEYLRLGMVDITSSATRGVVCPLSAGNGKSGIALLSEAFLYVYSTLREHREDSSRTASI